MTRIDNVQSDSFTEKVELKLQFESPVCFDKKELIEVVNTKVYFQKWILFRFKLVNFCLQPTKYNVDMLKTLKIHIK